MIISTDKIVKEIFDDIIENEMYDEFQTINIDAFKWTISNHLEEIKLKIEQDVEDELKKVSIYVRY